MKKIIVAGIFLALLVAAGAFLYHNYSYKLPEIQKAAQQALDELKNISTPPPLKSSKNALGSLSKTEVIRLTNNERTKQGLPPLKENSQLDVSAKVKAQDMLARQYFEHQSPTGERVADLVEKTGYKYVILGENLAMGGFENDDDLVQAWMNSEGHRENILNPNYKEIGVAVVKGVFAGKETWMAVQHFGASISTCPEIDESLKTAVQTNEVKIENLDNILNSMRSQINSRKTADQFNALVAEYNNLVEENKSLIKRYNFQVTAFNNCLSNLTK